MTARAGVAAPRQLPVEQIKLPPGFKIEVYSSQVPNARAMALGEKGTLFVGTLREGKVYALRPPTNRRESPALPGGPSANANPEPEVLVIAEGLRMPAGVAFHDGDLYVSAVDRILKFEDIEDRLEAPPPPVVVTDAYPGDAHHGWKFIRFGPDGNLYVPVGAPCNVCLRDDDPRYASITRLRPDGTGLEIFARGVRNTVGFDWHPVTGELWFTENGRDWLGDNRPPDELNHAPAAGLHFGFPFCHGAQIQDPEYGKSCEAFRPPARELGAHVASLGMRFYTGAMFPEAYRGQIFIAEHGSWNRSRKTGYRVTLVRLDGDRAVSYEPFAEGWLTKGRVDGRPADVQVLKDGSLLVSDDYAGAIYRITYSGGAAKKE